MVELKTVELQRVFSVRVGARRRYRIELTLMKTGTWCASVTRRDRQQIGVWITKNKTPAKALWEAERWIRRSIARFT